VKLAFWPELTEALATAMPDAGAARMPPELASWLSPSTTKIVPEASIAIPWG
jgi:hypothetical protein